VEFKDWMMLASFGLSITALIISLVTNTKKYELKNLKRKEILDWYEKTIAILIELKHLAEYNTLAEDIKIKKMSELYKQIECGRFLFPNIDKNDEYGKDKPVAYQGYRALVLDLLVFYYNMIKDDAYLDHKEHIEILIRYFTSSIFEILDPKQHLNETNKVTKKTFSQQLTYQDFLTKEPEIIYKYI
jgi:hypothetical protein